jgi:hypothetical protein
MASEREHDPIAGADLDGERARPISHRLVCFEWLKQGELHGLDLCPSSGLILAVDDVPADLAGLGAVPGGEHDEDRQAGDVASDRHRKTSPG